MTPVSASIIVQWDGSDHVRTHDPARKHLYQHVLERAVQFNLALLRDHIDIYDHIHFHICGDGRVHDQPLARGLYSLGIQLL